MRDALLPYLTCPAGCAGDLSPRGSRCDEGHLIDGALDCAACGRSYPVEEGIPRMLPAALVEAGEAAPATPEAVAKRSEMRARDDQADDYDRMWQMNLFALAEIPATLALTGLAPHHRLLEGGCGTGRMTPDFAARCTHLVSVDFSFQSLLRCARKLRRAGVHNADLVQADITRLPLRTGMFDRVVSCQVLEHVPTPDSRAAAVAELARAARDGGRVMISAYQHNLFNRVFGEKEGEHTGGIYFYRFDRREFTDLLERSLRVDYVTGALAYHYMAACRKEA